MGKQHLSEEDIKARYITPAITNAGWDIKKQVRLEYAFTAGRIILQGNITARGKKKRADYVLFYKNNFPLAIVKAKDNTHSIGAGLQQAIEYANALDIDYVYASNGDGFIEQNRITGEVRELTLQQFPSPEELYQRYRHDKNTSPAEEKVLLESYYYVPNYKIPRYYQRIAINRTVDAVAKGKIGATCKCHWYRNTQCQGSRDTMTYTKINESHIDKGGIAYETKNAYCIEIQRYCVFC